MSARLGKIFAVLLVVALVLVAWRGGVFARLATPRDLVRQTIALGAWGYVGFLVAYAVLQPFGVPGTVFVFAAPLIWPWPTAFALSMTGTLLASVVGFSFARYVARDWVAQRVPARVRRYEEALDRHAFRTVALLRALFWMPQWLHFFFGVSRVSFATHFWASLVGYVAPLLAVSYFASRIVDADGHLLPGAWRMFGIGLGAIAVLVVVAWLLSRRGRKA